MILVSVCLTSELVCTQSAVFQRDAIIETNSLWVNYLWRASHPVVSKEAERPVVGWWFFWQREFRDHVPLSVVNDSGFSKGGLLRLPPIQSDSITLYTEVVPEERIIR